jgi:hypothetical protein
VKATSVQPRLALLSTAEKYPRSAERHDKDGDPDDRREILPEGGGQQSSKDNHDDKTRHDNSLCTTHRHSPPSEHYLEQHSQVVSIEIEHEGGPSLCVISQVTTLLTLNPCVKPTLRKPPFPYPVYARTTHGPLLHVQTRSSSRRHPPPPPPRHHSPPPDQVTHTRPRANDPRTATYNMDDASAIGDGTEEKCDIRATCPSLRITSSAGHPNTNTSRSARWSGSGISHAIRAPTSAIAHDRTTKSTNGAPTPDHLPRHHPRLQAPTARRASVRGRTPLSGSAPDPARSEISREAPPGQERRHRVPDATVHRLVILAVEPLVPSSALGPSWVGVGVSG